MKILPEVTISLVDALHIADLLDDMTRQEQPCYRADEAKVVLDGLREYIGQSIDINEQEPV
jgi:hypothetical protein